MNIEEIQKILFSLYLLRNNAVTAELRATAQESIDAIERHLGIKE